MGGSLTRSMLAGMIGFLDLQQNSVENWYFNDTISDHPALVNGKLQMWLISGRNPSQMRQIFDVFHHVLSCVVGSVKDLNWSKLLEQ